MPLASWLLLFWAFAMPPTRNRPLTVPLPVMSKTTGLALVDAWLAAAPTVHAGRVLLLSPLPASL